MFVYRNKSSTNENLRLALAGCIAVTTVETTFHMIDTVNIRSKANPHMGSSSMATLVTKIWTKEGIIGFGRGFSAAFYVVYFQDLLTSTYTSILSRFYSRNTNTRLMSAGFVF